jgi:hypothetical protein
MDFYLGSNKEENITMVTNPDPTDTNNNSGKKYDEYQNLSVLEEQN